MLKRFLAGKSGSIAGAAVLLGVMTLVSRLLGLFRDRLLTGTFGAGQELDAYYAAFRAPDLIYSLFVYGAITGGFIPVFADFLAKADGRVEAGERAWEFVSRILTVLGVTIMGLALIGAAFARPLVAAFTPGFGGGQLDLTVGLTRLMFLSPVLLGLSGIMGGVLQTFRRFLVFATAPLLYNGGIIFGVAVLAPRWGIRGVALGVVLGSLLHFLIQYAGCRAMGFRFRVIFAFRDRNLLRIIRLMVPRTASLAVSSINLIIITAIASTLSVGSISVINLANNLQSFPINLLGVSFAVAAFPFITELAVQGRRDELRKTFARAVRVVLFLIIPATVCFLLLRAQIVRVVLGVGKFDWADTIATADVLAYFSLSLFAQALIPLVIRAFLALQDARTPLLACLAAVVLERLLAWRLIAVGWGVAGLALAASIGAVLNLTLLWLPLRGRIGGLEENSIFRSVGQMSLCALLAAAAIQAVKIWLGVRVNMDTFVGIFTQGAVAGLAGLAVYFGLALAFKSEEASFLLRFLKRRAAPVPADVPLENKEGGLEQG